MYKISTVEKVARYIKNNPKEFDRLNKVVEYCNKNNLTAEEIEFVKLVINNRIIILWNIIKKNLYYMYLIMNMVK